MHWRCGRGRSRPRPPRRAPTSLPWCHCFAGNHLVQPLAPTTSIHTLYITIKCVNLKYVKAYQPFWFQEYIFAFSSRQKKILWQYILKQAQLKGYSSLKHLSHIYGIGDKWMIAVNTLNKMFCTFSKRKDHMKEQDLKDLLCFMFLIKAERPSTRFQVLYRRNRTV